MIRIVLIRIVRNASGQILVVLPLILAMALGSALMWGLLAMKNQASRGTLVRSEMERVVGNILNRVHDLLVARANPGVSPCDPITNDAFFPLRNFRLAAPYPTGNPAFVPLPAPNFGFSMTWTGSLTSPVYGCLIMTDEVQYLNGFTLSVNRITPNDAALLTLNGYVQVSVQAQSNPAPNIPARTVSETRTFSLRVPSLSHYAVILRDPTPYSARPRFFASRIDTPITAANPQIRVTDASNLEILGPMYHAGDPTPAAPLDIRTIFPIPSATTTPPIMISQNFDIRSVQFQWLSAEASGQSFDQRIKKAYRGGINPGTYVNAINPLEDPGPYGTPSPLQNSTAWQQVLQYQPVASPSATVGPFFALPYMGNQAATSTLPTFFYVGSLASPVSPAIPLVQRQTFEYDKAYYGNPSYPTPYPIWTTAFPPAPGPTNTIPDPAPWKGIRDLSYTCTALGAGEPPRPFVFQRMMENLRIDFQTQKTLNGPNKSVFCGLIAVDKLFIQTAADEDAAIFGIVIATQIQVSGGKKVRIVNPAYEARLPTGSMGSSVSQSDVYSQMQMLGSTYGHNFFVPFLQRNPAGLIISPNDPAYFPFRPGGLLVPGVNCGDDGTPRPMGPIGAVCRSVFDGYWYQLLPSPAPPVWFSDTTGFHVLSVIPSPNSTYADDFLYGSN